VIVNILLVGILMTRMALGSGIVVALLWIVLFTRYRSAFAGIFQARVPAASPRTLDTRATPTMKA
jgi:hypothetical protein